MAEDHESRRATNHNTPGRTNMPSSNIQRYQELFRLVNHGIVIYRPTCDGQDFVFEDLNPASERIEHVHRSDLIGKTVSELFPGIHEMGLFDVFRRVCKTGKPEVQTAAMYRDERISGWRENHVFRLSTGELVSVYTDITERKTAEEALRQREVELERSQEVSHVGSWGWDIDCDKVHWSEEMYRIYGVDRKTFPHRLAAVSDLIHPDDLWKNQRAIVDAYLGKAFHPFEYRIQRHDGSQRIVQVQALQLERGQDGRPKFMFGVAQDVTTQKRAEGSLQETLEKERTARIQLERAVRLREELLAVVSHDLKNPLASIRLNSELSLKTLPKDSTFSPLRKSLEAIRCATDMMTRIISDLLDIAKIETGQLSVEAKPENAGALIRDAIDALRPIAFQKNIQLLTDIPTDPLSVRADRERIIQVFSNLIGNAVKFTQTNGQVTVGAAKHNSDVWFWVEDNGPGIPAELLSKIFDRFWQGRSHRQGSGLGLSIAKGIVETHGGKIWVQSKPGEGSVFCFTLPRVIQEPRRAA